MTLDLTDFKLFLRHTEFLDNKYTKWYYLIVCNRLLNTNTSCCEEHHIIPQSFGSIYDDTVLLSLREHYIVHLLLTKMVVGDKRKKMLFALVMMSSTRSGLKCNSRLYEKFKQLRSQAMTLTTTEFIEKARSIHSYSYDYSKAEYVRNDVEVEITCPKHGSFWQKPSYHLGGSRCQKCTKNTKLNTEDFVKKATIVHNGKYTYLKCTYVNSYSKVCVTCPLHGDFEINPASHLRGSGCRACGYLLASEKISAKMKGNIPWNKKK